MQTTDSQESITELRREPPEIYVETTTLEYPHRPTYHRSRGTRGSRDWQAMPLMPGLIITGMDRPVQAHAGGMHALRHFCASTLLTRGVSIKELAEYLDHSDPGFTLWTYTHLVPSSYERARQAIDGVFGLIMETSDQGIESRSMI